MEEKTTPVDVLLQRAQAYIKTSILLFKLKATEKLAELLSEIASGFVIGIFIVLFFVNLNIGIAILVGDLLGKIWLGFVIVACFYLLVDEFYGTKRITELAKLIVTGATDSTT